MRVNLLRFATDWSPTQHRTCVVPSSYHRRTRVASCSDFALRRNPRMQRRRYDDGTAQVRSRYLEFIVGTQFLFNDPGSYSNTIFSTVLLLPRPLSA